MAKMTLAQLKALRTEKKKDIDRRDNDGKDVMIVVGMGTCGIAAGGKNTIAALIEEIREHDLTNVTIKQTGCMGLCHSEPTVDVKVPGMPDTIYGNVDADVAKEVIIKHVIGKEMISKHVLDRPASDIMKEQK